MKQPYSWVQYTLVYIISEDRVVHQKSFNTMQELRDFKNYYVDELKGEDMTCVDGYGYVWFCQKDFQED